MTAAYDLGAETVDASAVVVGWAFSESSIDELVALTMSAGVAAVVVVGGVMPADPVGSIDRRTADLGSTDVTRALIPSDGAVVEDVVVVDGVGSIFTSVGGRTSLSFSRESV